jgi:hypothetical protein
MLKDYINSVAIADAKNLDEVFKKLKKQKEEYNTMDNKTEGNI